jgi:hypothetical protein
MNVKLISAAMIVVCLLTVGCGSDKSPTATHKVLPLLSITESADYQAAKSACGAAPRKTIARRLHLSTNSPAAIAQKYALLQHPGGVHEPTYRGCLAGLPK